MPQCSHCRYWDRMHPDGDMGNCRRYPPQASEILAAENASESSVICHNWPLTMADHWCGEFQDNALPSVYFLKPSVN